jgi:hypothetical protein
MIKGDGCKHFLASRFKVQGFFSPVSYSTKDEHEGAAAFGDRALND